MNRLSKFFLVQMELWCWIYNFDKFSRNYPCSKIVWLIRSFLRLWSYHIFQSKNWKSYSFSAKLIQVAFALHNYILYHTGLPSIMKDYPKKVPSNYHPTRRVRGFEESSSSSSDEEETPRRRVKQTSARVLRKYQHFFL